MKTLKFLWKLYFHSFPMSHLGPNSNNRKASKGSLQSTLCFSAPAFTIFYQWWDNQFFNTQMDTKWNKSRIFGNLTSLAFQWAISGPILTPGRHPKVACNQRYVFLHQDSPVLTSVGRMNFWTTKWTPNEKIQAFLEIRLPHLSKEPSRAQCWHREGLQNWFQSRATLLEKCVTLLCTKSPKGWTSARRSCSTGHQLT